MTAQDQQSRAELRKVIEAALEGVHIENGSAGWFNKVAATVTEAVLAARALPAGMAPVAEIENGSLRWHIPAADYSVDVKRLTGLHQLFTAAQVQAMGRVPLTDEQIREWWASENGLEDCDMGKLVDFTAVVRAVEAKLCVTGGAHGGN